MPGVEFKVFDVDGDGFYTAADRRTLSKALVDALRAENIETVDAFLKITAVVAIPPGWVKDHLSHAPMWDFVSKLRMPVGIFHGEVDVNTPVSRVRELEKLAVAAGKSNVEFHYFADLDHGLGSTDYFRLGGLSAGYTALFDFMKRHVDAQP